MPHLDPYGVSHTTPAPPEPKEGQPIPLPEREEEIELARGISESELQHDSEELSTSGLDLALRLQDAVGTWHEGDDTMLEEIGAPGAGDHSEPEPEPFVPLTDSGGQGL